MDDIDDIDNINNIDDVADVNKFYVVDTKVQWFVMIAMQCQMINAMQ